MNTQTMLDTFFLPEDQDAFAQSLGWEDAAQMAYYEDMAQQEEQNQLPPPPPVIYVHELQQQDSREVYKDMAGVY